MIKNISKTEVEKLSDRNLQRAIIELTDELVFVHGYSSEDAATFAQRDCIIPAINLREMMEKHNRNKGLEKSRDYE